VHKPYKYLCRFKLKGCGPEDKALHVYILYVLYVSDVSILNDAYMCIYIYIRHNIYVLSCVKILLKFKLFPLIIILKGTLCVYMDCFGSEEYQTNLQIHVSRLQITGSEMESMARKLGAAKFHSFAHNARPKVSDAERR